jgi:hypothetical protein
MNVYEYTPQDMLTLSCMVIIAQALIFYFFTVSLKKSKLTHAVLIMYLVGLFLVFLSPLNFQIFALIISLFFMLLTLLNLIEHKDEVISKVGYVSLIYSGLAIIMFFLLFFRTDLDLLFISIANLAFLPFAYYLSHSFSPYSVSEEKEVKEKSIILMFIKYFIFITAFTNILLISTLGFHELSHVAVARLYGCDAKAVFFEKNIYPYSEITCESTLGMNIIALAGPILPILCALLLFFVEKSITRASALMVIGFNLTAAYSDFKEVHISGSIILVFTLLGVILLLLGLIHLAQFIFYSESRNKDSRNFI